MKNLTKQDLVVKNKKVYVNGNISNGKPGMILIWAEWCPHCHRFMPTYKQMSQKLHSQFPCLLIESGELKSEVSDTLQLSSYPSIYFFDKNGQIIEKYTNTREQNVLLAHVCKIYHRCV
jgi:thiol-disulfide isomerase/thioredoxin